MARLWGILGETLPVIRKSFASTHAESCAGIDVVACVRTAPPRPGEESGPKVGFTPERHLALPANNKLQGHLYTSANVRSHSARRLHILMTARLHVYSELAFFYQDGASHLFPEAWYVYFPSQTSLYPHNVLTG